MGCSRCASLDGRGLEGEGYRHVCGRVPPCSPETLTTLSVANVLLEASSEKGHQWPEIKLVSFISEFRPALCPECLPCASRWAERRAQRRMMAGVVVVWGSPCSQGAWG